MAFVLHPLVNNNTLAAVVTKNACKSIYLGVQLDTAGPLIIMLIT